MPRPTKTEETTADAAAPLQPFNVVIDGRDMTILARDEADLAEKIAKIRKQ